MSLSSGLLRNQLNRNVPKGDPLIEALSAYVAQRENVRTGIVQFKKIYSVHKAQLEALHKEYHEVLQYEELAELSKAGEQVVELHDVLRKQKHLRVPIADKIDTLLPWSVVELLKQGNKINIPRGLGESTFLIWYSENGEYLVESLGFEQDPVEVYNKSWTNMTISDMLKDGGVPEVL